MKRRKTAILLALALSVTAVFTACGGSSQSSSAPAGPAEQTEAAEPAEAADQTQATDAGAADQAQATDAGAADQAQATDAGAADQTQAGADAAAEPAAPAQEAAAQPAVDKFHVELEEVGRVSDKNNYRVTYDSLVHNEGDHVSFCDFKGNPVDDRPLMNMEYLGWGLYSVTVQIEGDVNSTGLVDAEGEVLIPFNAAIIKFPNSHPNDVRPRYVLVLTGTEQTTNQDEALFFVTSRQFAITANVLCHEPPVRHHSQR